MKIVLALLVILSFSFVTGNFALVHVFETQRPATEDIQSGLTIKYKGVDGPRFISQTDENLHKALFGAAFISGIPAGLLWLIMRSRKAR